MLASSGAREIVADATRAQIVVARHALVQDRMFRAAQALALALARARAQAQALVLILVPVLALALGGRAKFGGGID